MTSPPTGSTHLAGVIGWPVRHSRSPAIHNAAYRALGLDWVYVALPVPPGEVPAALGGMRALGIEGLSVTLPHKAAVAAEVDVLAADAAALGAVNSVRRDGDRLVGDNTDGGGFVDSLLDAGVDPAGRRCVVLGAGDGERPDHGTGRPACPEDHAPSTGRVDAVLAERVDEAAAVGVVADEAVAVAPDAVHGPQGHRVVGEGVDGGGRSRLVGHGHRQPLEAQGPHAREGGLDLPRCHREGDVHPVEAGRPPSTTPPTRRSASTGSTSPCPCRPVRFRLRWPACGYSASRACR
ncbi:MAG TPA: hypothetical protein VGE43_04250 [Acidimicrobiales bacterium]